jgi:hypothetical protein
MMPASLQNPQVNSCPANDDDNNNNKNNNNILLLW